MRLVSPIKYRSYVLLRFIISSKAVSVNIAVVLGMMLLHLVIVQLFWEDVVACGDIAFALPGSKTNFLSRFRTAAVFNCLIWWLWVGFREVFAVIVSLTLTLITTL